MNRKHIPLVFVAIVVLLPVAVYAVVQWYDARYKKLPVYDDVQAAKFTLHNAAGVTVTEVAFKNKIIVANFFFTLCPVVCPKMTAQLKRVAQQFEKDNQVVIASFSVDPERDSTQRLQQYATQFRINIYNWQLLTGDKKQIYRLARHAFRVTATDGDGGPQDFIHSDKLILMDRSSRIRGYYNGTDATETAQLIKDIQRLLKEE